MTQPYQAQVGDVMYSPGSSSKARTTDAELLYVSNPGSYIKKGCTLETGHGLLLPGTPIKQKTDGTKLFVPAASNSTQTNVVTITSGNASLAFASAHGLNVGDEVVLAGVSGAVTNLVAGVAYYVQAVADGTHAALAATPGGAAIVPNGAGNATGTSESETDASTMGFLYVGANTGSTGDVPRQGNIILGGVLKYALIKAANGGVDLDAGTLAALGARINTVFGFLKF